MTFRHYLVIVGMALMLVSLVGIIVGTGPLAIIGVGMLGLGTAMIGVATLSTPLGD